MIKQRRIDINGWLLSDGSIKPYEFLNGKPKRWQHTTYHKQGLKLKNLEQDFYVQQEFYRSVS